MKPAIFASAIIIGALPLTVQPQLPALAWVALATGFGCLLCAWRPTRLAGVVVLCGCWAQLAALQTLATLDRLAQNRQSLDVSILTTGEQEHYQVQAYARAGRLLWPGITIALRGHFPAATCSGQRWRVVAHLRPIHGAFNDGGFDRQRFALSQHQVMEGWLSSAQPLSLACSLRGRLIARATQQTQHLTWQGVILALLFGERQQLDSPVKELLRETGTAHLMAISGLHIALAASLGVLLARACQGLFAAWRITAVVPVMAGIVTGALYTWLAGAGPPAMRALLALILWAAIRLSGRQWQSEQIWLSCVALLIFIDPVVVLSDSFRLSVTVVAGLIVWFKWAPMPLLSQSRLITHIGTLIWLELGISLVLLPVQIWIFHGISFSAPIANLLAVPWVSFITLPIIFAALLVSAWPALAQALWWLADQTLHLLFIFLAALPRGWLDVDRRFTAITLLPVALVMFWRFGWWRYYWPPGVGLMAILCQPLLTPSQRGWSLHMLDVGHGLAIVIARGQHGLIYDTGNAWPEGSYARSVIIPWLRWHAITPEQIIISHEHLDHRGGLPDLHHRWPSALVISPLGWPGHLPCHRGLHWIWQGLSIETLWPLRQGREAGNNGSCVIRISDGVHRVLLTGDIERPAELYLQQLEGHRLRADVLQVGHHGSTTSSGSGFIRLATNKLLPGLALASTARYNRWHLPAGKIVKRFRQQGWRWRDTAHEGQISVYFQGKRVQISGLRTQISPRWFHQWFGDDPLNR